ncbi:cyclophilin-like fold protein [Microbispora siamensis]|uniref:Cyclophilin-like domain-containing protein n=1 Tax=Microbispora siamensis TaxID=564413 RepID=A0ABQ4GK27_9ACTN|nr:cyclophilin-like fold protein [Microbispora siamensis]GIH61776.1 hypothetical protein Msi02_25930 [Microbispora siamensis]
MTPLCQTTPSRQQDGPETAHAPFHGTERIGYPPRKLTTDGAPEPAAAKAGDIAYFAPWGNLALFYRDGPSASADLLILGHIDADTDQLAKARRITIQTSP